MLGRAAYHTPGPARRRRRRDLRRPAAAAEIDWAALIETMAAYAARHIAAGGRLAHVTRHMVGLFHGLPGARRFRQILSTEATRAGRRARRCCAPPSPRSSWRRQAWPRPDRRAFRFTRHGHALPPTVPRKSEKQMHGMTMSAGEIAVFAAAIAASGVVSGLFAGVFGIGGGAVLVPVFYQAFGLLGVDEVVRMHVSVGSSLAIIIPTSIRSFNAHRARGAVDMELLRDFLIPVPIGVILAAIAAAYITSEGLRIIFSVITVLVGLKLLFNRESWRIGTKIPGNPWRAVIGVVIGFFSTLMGIGGGVMNNTFMTLYGRPMHQAVATSSGVGVMIAIPGTLGYIWAGWGDRLLPPVSPASSTGSRCSW